MQVRCQRPIGFVTLQLGDVGVGVITQAGYQLDIPLMFAALLLISLTGIALFGVMSWISRRALSAWHESEAVQSH